MKMLSVGSTQLEDIRYKLIKCKVCFQLVTDSLRKFYNLTILYFKYYGEVQRRRIYTKILNIIV